MDKETLRLVTAFAMGSIGAPPVGVSQAEEAAGQDGLRAMEAIALYTHVVRTLVAVDAAHPELGIRAELELVTSQIRDNEEIGPALARIDALLEQATPYLQE
ncbi:MAG: hypothetical protein WC654_03615 [Patescibacteria group bacterium]